MASITTVRQLQRRNASAPRRRKAALRARKVSRLSPSSEIDHTRFDRRQSEILKHATEVFCEKGYAAASMRDLSRCSGMSLAGLYHYFESKEKLLYLIQKQTFTTIIKD